MTFNLLKKKSLYLLDGTVCLFICVCMYVCICIYIYIYIYICVCVCVCVLEKKGNYCVCVCVCVWVYIIYFALKIAIFIEWPGGEVVNVQIRKGAKSLFIVWITLNILFFKCENIKPSSGCMGKKRVSNPFISFGSILFQMYDANIFENLF